MNSTFLHRISVSCLAIALSFAIISPAAHSATMTDSRDGKTYRTVKIGSQTWMAENLNFKTPNSICKDQKSTLCQKYGRFYTWIDAMQISSAYTEKTYKSKGSVQGICPQGWHLPSYEEWSTLLKNVKSKVPKEKEWIALLNKKETFEKKHFACCAGMCSEEMRDFFSDFVKSLGSGNVHYESKKDCSSDDDNEDGPVGSFSREFGTDMFGFNALVVGTVYYIGEDASNSNYTAFWTSTDAYGTDKNGKSFYKNIASNLGSISDGDDDLDGPGNKNSIKLPVRCIRD